MIGGGDVLADGGRALSGVKRTSAGHTAHENRIRL